MNKKYILQLTIIIVTHINLGKTTILKYQFKIISLQATISTSLKVHYM